MNLKQLINKSVYGTIGYITSKDDLNLLEQYIVYNLPVLKEFKQIIVATNYKTYPNLIEENTQLWKKYFSNSIILDSKINRGHQIGTADLDNIIFDYCKENNIKWLCKSANDIILQKELLNKKIKNTDFYYLSSVGLGGLQHYNFDKQKLIDNDFTPQTNFYFINVSKTDYLNDKENLNKVWNLISKSDNDKEKKWEFGLKSCEYQLHLCVNRNKLSKFNLIPLNKFLSLLDIIINYNIHDGSHKNIMIENICHFHFPNQPIIEI